jgi:nucleoid-associated protein YgaU/DNA-binding SARP family transcriptional activator
MWSAIARLIQALLALAALVAVGAAFGLFLLWADGWPHLPALPPIEEIPAILRREGVPPAAVRYAAVTAGWLLLAYAAVALVLEAVATTLELGNAAGRAGVRRVRRAADRLAPGVVRRIVAGAAAALLTIGAAVRPPLPVAAKPASEAIALILDRPRPPVAAAAPPPAAPPAATASIDAATPDAGAKVIRLDERRASAVAVTAPGGPDAAAGQVMVVDAAGALRPLEPSVSAADAAERYTVVKGDNLWWIAIKLWGEPTAWPELWRANENQVMPSGRRFTDPHLVWPGDVLVVPAHACAQPCILVDHVVRPGETLGGIARRYLGARGQAMVIFEANKGVIAPNGERLTDPDLIWPGMVLRIPRPAAAARAPVPAATPAPASNPGHDVPTPAPPPPTSPVEANVVAPDAPSRAARQAARLRQQAEAEAATEASALARRAAEALTGITTRPESASDQPAVTALPSSAPDAAAATAPEPAADGAGEEAVPSPSVATAPPAPAAQTPSYTDLLAGVVAGALVLTTGGWWVADRLRRRRALAARPSGERVVPLHFSRVDPAGAAGPAKRPLAAQLAQRAAGLETDERVVLTERLVEALAAAGYLEAAIATLTTAGSRATYHVRLGAPPPADLATLTEALEGIIASPIDAAARAGDEVALTLTDVHVDERWAARPPAPRAILLEVGLAADGVLAVGPEGLDGALLAAGADAPMALQHGLLGLAGLCRKDDLRLALLAGEPLAGWLRGLPHLLDAPCRADSEEADRLLLGLHEELRLRQAGDDHAGTDLLMLVIEGMPAAERLAEVRDLARDGARVGIGVIVLAADGAGLDAGLLDACRGRLLTGGLDEAAATRLAGRPGAAGLGPGAAWWLRPGEAPTELRLFAMSPEEREACLAAMRAASAGSPPIPAEEVAATDLNELPIGPDEPDAGQAEPAVEATDSVTPPPTGLTATRAASAPMPVFPALGAPPADRIVVRVFGAPEVSYGGRAIAINRPTVLEHLCYLALHEPHEADAERLLEALRGERGVPASGVRAIHSSTGRLREALRAALPPGSPDPILHRGGGFALNPDVVWVDRWAFDRLVAGAGALPDDEALPLLRAALALYHGPVCQGHGFGWVGSLRARYQEAARDDVALVAAAAESRAGRLRAAIEVYQALRRADVLDDVIIEREMTCWARLGDAGALTAAFEGWRRQLELTAEMRPMRRTAELFARLVQNPHAASEALTDDDGLAELAG